MSDPLSRDAASEAFRALNSHGWELRWRDRKRNVPEGFGAQEIMTRAIERVMARRASPIASDGGDE